MLDVGGISPTVQGAGTVANLPGTQTIVQITVLEDGVYDVLAQAGYGSTAGDAGATLDINGVVYAVIPVSPLALASPAGTWLRRVPISARSAVSLNVRAGGLGVGIWIGSLTATRIS